MVSQRSAKSEGDASARVIVVDLGNGIDGVWDNGALFSGDLALDFGEEFFVDRPTAGAVASFPIG